MQLRTPKADATIKPIAEDPQYATESAILQTLERGRTEIEAEIGALRIEDFLARPTTARPDPRARAPRNVLRVNSRTATLAATLAAHRAKVPAKAEGPQATSGSETVSAALEIIAGARPPSRVNRQKLIEQLEADLDVVRAAVLTQSAIVDAQRDALSAALAEHLVPRHRALVLKVFRAAQALAAAVDEEQALRTTTINGGYVWRADLLRGPQLRAALVLGSESTFDSDISRARRYLEEEHLL